MMTVEMLKKEVKEVENKIEELQKKLSLAKDEQDSKWAKVEKMENANKDEYTKEECEKIYDEYEQANNEYHKIDDEIDLLEKIKEHYKEIIEKLEDIEWIKEYR